mgnify:CR=1 FL=1
MSEWGAPLVHVTRGRIVESLHAVAFVVSDRDGHVIARAGDVDHAIYPRSAIKPIQALPLVETGAADAYALGSEELALACASHSGEPMHTERVAAWLARLGVDDGVLACGAHLPYHEATAHALLRQGLEPRPVHNNCSGKHAGMVTTALFKGEPLAGYERATHPVHQRVLGTLEQMTGQDLSHAPHGVDGCSIPTIAVSIGGLAVAMAHFADPADLPEHRAAAVQRIRAAWSGHPELMSGSDHFDAAFNRHMAGRAACKGGAEGVMCATLVEAGLGLAIKVADGNGRASAPALGAVLNRLNLLTADDNEALAPWFRPTLTNRAGIAVGEIRALEPA